MVMIIVPFLSHSVFQFDFQIHLVANVWPIVPPVRPPVITIVSPSGIPQAFHPGCCNAKFAPPPPGRPPVAKKVKTSPLFKTCHNFCKVYSSATKQYKLRRVRRPGHMVDSCCPGEWVLKRLKDTIGWPQCVEVRPAGAPLPPGDARFIFGIPPADNQPSPRQKREAVRASWFRQVGYGARARGRAREEFNRWEVDRPPTSSANDHLLWCKTD